MVKNIGIAIAGLVLAALFGFVGGKFANSPAGQQFGDTVLSGNYIFQDGIRSNGAIKDSNGTTRISAAGAATFTTGTFTGAQTGTSETLTGTQTAGGGTASSTSSYTAGSDTATSTTWVTARKTSAECQIHPACTTAACTGSGVPTAWYYYIYTTTGIQPFATKPTFCP